MMRLYCIIIYAEDESVIGSITEKNYKQVARENAALSGDTYCSYTSSIT